MQLKGLATLLLAVCCASSCGGNDDCHDVVRSEGRMLVLDAKSNSLLVLLEGYRYAVCEGGVSDARRPTFVLGMQSFTADGDSQAEATLSTLDYASGLLVPTANGALVAHLQHAPTLFNPVTLAELATVADLELRLQDARTSPSGRFVLATNLAGSLVAIDTEALETSVPSVSGGPEAESLTWAKVSDDLYGVTCQDELRFRVRRWNMATLASAGYPVAGDSLWQQPEQDRQIEGTQCYAATAAVSGDDRWLAVGARSPLGGGAFEDVVILYDPETKTSETLLGVGPPFALSPDGAELVGLSTAAAGGLAVVDLATLELRTLPGPVGTLDRVAFTTNTQAVVLTAEDTIALLDTQSDALTELPGTVFRAGDAGGVRHEPVFDGARLRYAARLNGPEGDVSFITFDLATGQQGEHGLGRRLPIRFIAPPGGDQAALLLSDRFHADDALQIATQLELIDANGNVARSLDLVVSPPELVDL